MTAWWAEDERDLATALDIMRIEAERQEREAGKVKGRRREDDGRVMGSG